MDKTKKLKNYQRKDYSQLVKFPVEIIGRDGIVRRYSFEASVRLYQRRIASASLRYHDPDVAGAEAGHCRSRITQLRRSYCEHYGWPILRQDEGLGEFAGEVVAFLRRFLGDEEVEIELGNLNDNNDGFVWFVDQPSVSRRYLLYLYRFESNGPCPSRESFFQLLRWVQGASGEEVERLTAFHHTADCGLVLTTTGRQAEEQVQRHEFFYVDPVRDGALSATAGPLDAFQRGLRALSIGDADGSLAHFEHAIAEYPYRQTAHSCVIAVTDYLDRPEETEIATKAALHYFPESADLHYMQAVALYKMSQSERARSALFETNRIQGETERSRALALRLALQEGDWKQAADAACRSIDRPEVAVQNVLRLSSIQRILRWRNLFGRLALVGCVIGLGLAFFQPSFSVGFVVASIGSAFLSRVVLPRKLAFALAESRRSLGLGLPENLLMEGAAER